MQIQEPDHRRPWMTRQRILDFVLKKKGNNITHYNCFRKMVLKAEERAVWGQCETVIISWVGGREDTAEI